MLGSDGFRRGGWCCSNLQKGKNQMDIVLIKWFDSKSGPAGWEYLDGIDPVEPISCVSVGFLLEENESYKTIAPTVGGGQVLGRVTIPQCSITDMRKLSEGD